jgi:hypothetical protein
VLRFCLVELTGQATLTAACAYVKIIDLLAIVGLVGPDSGP